MFKKFEREKFKKNYTGTMLVAPGLLLIFMILVVPIFFTIFISFHDYSYLNLGDFVGLDNYDVLIDAQTINSLGRTIFISLLGVALSMFFGLSLALLVDKERGKFGYVIQLVALLTWITSMIVSSLIWRWILDNDAGLLNYGLRKIGLGTVNVFSNANFAIATLIFVMSWRTIGYAMIMILAGLKGISNDQIEAGKVDGANNFQILKNIKLPLIKTQMLIASIVILLSNFNNMTVPLTLTAGGPAGATTVVSLLLFRLGFLYFSYGRASALSFFILIITTIFIVAYMKLVKYDI